MVKIFNTSGLAFLFCSLPCCYRCYQFFINLIIVEMIINHFAIMFFAHYYNTSPLYASLIMIYLFLCSVKPFRSCFENVAFVYLICFFKFLFMWKINNQIKNFISVSSRIKITLISNYGVAWILQIFVTVIFISKKLSQL